MSGKLVIDAYIELEVRDRDGRLIGKYRAKARSWVKNWMILLRSMLGRVIETAVCTDGSSCDVLTNWVDVNNYVKASGVNAPAGDDSYGLVIGSGTTAVSPDDYSLASQIGNAVMEHGDTTVETVAVSDSTVVLRIVRTFTNVSGGSVTVSEVGLVFLNNIRIAGTDYTRYVLIARDVLGTSQSVPDGSTLTVRYVLQFTVG